ncbi:MAG: UDP-N-acetylmuramate--L-alanine ligase [Armatimonadota bacterium]
MTNGGAYHLIGIGGSGMSAIAHVLLEKGCRVSGSDLTRTRVTEALSAKGATVFIGHSKHNLNGAQAVVVSAAVKADNPELQAAKECGLPILSRAEMLGLLMEGTYGIAVAGTHGKTTTSAMIATVLLHCGLQPTFLLGGEALNLGGNAGLGRGPYLVAEACEAYGSFLHLRPKIAVVTNIDADHLDYYGDIDGVRAGFAQFLSQVDPDGWAVICTDCPNARSLVSKLRCRCLTYGLAGDADIAAADIAHGEWGLTYRLVQAGKAGPKVHLRVPGYQNVANSLAALAVAHAIGVKMDDAAAALAEFTGVARRFEIIGEAGGVRIIDDYAHHPAEIAATLKTAREWLSPRRLFAVFQPHLYSRTLQLMDEFAMCFAEADVLVVTDIYKAREEPIPGATGQELVRKAQMLREGRETQFVAPKESIPEYLVPRLRAGDVVMLLGAGDIYEIGGELLRLLRGG